MDTCAVDDFEKVCRICMKFNKTFLSITSFKIIDMIIACASVQIWENDDLPNQICHGCFLQLQNTINFKQLCENSDQAFRQIIKQNKIDLSSNENDFDNVKNEECEDYASTDSLVDIKEEDIPENITNDKCSLSNVKIRINHNENYSNKLEKNMLEVKNKDSPKLNEMCKKAKKYVTCHICGKSVTKKNLSSHMVIHTEREIVTCDICSKTFMHQKSLKNHIKQIHENQIPARNHLCNICGHAARSAADLRRHLILHTNDRPYACDRCDKTYRRPENLKEHISRIHLNQRKFQCTTCPQAFHERKTLVQHVRRHMGEKPHKCEVCDKAFAQKPDLRRHLLIHSNERPFACDRCHKKYRRADHLKEHISHAHLNQRKFQCTLCPQAFYEKRTLVHHLERHSGGNLHKCEVCGKAFAQKTALKIHTKIHSNLSDNFTQN